GTPEYMSPEQARGAAVDSRADLFSLGSVLYAMCTGQPPFRGASTVAVLRQVSDDAPTAIRAHNPQIPDWLETLVGRLMEKSPEHRIQSAAEVAAMLEGYSVHWREPATTAAPDLGQAVGVNGQARRETAKRWRWLLAAGAFAVCAVVAG